MNTEWDADHPSVTVFAVMRAAHVDARVRPYHTFPPGPLRAQSPAAISDN